MTRDEKLEALYEAALALKNTFLKDVNYAKSTLSAEDIAALNEFYLSLKNLETTQ